MQALMMFITNDIFNGHEMITPCKHKYNHGLRKNNNMFEQ